MDVNVASPKEIMALRTSKDSDQIYNGYHKQKRSQHLGDAPMVQSLLLHTPEKAAHKENKKDRDKW